MRSYIITVRLEKRPNHDPRNKVTGPCPIFTTRQCTDTTGEHHSFVYSSEDDKSIDEVQTLWKERTGGHITRIEEV